MAQARLLAGLPAPALDRERRRLGVGEQLGRGDPHLEGAGRDLGVDGLGIAVDDGAGDA